MAIDGINQNTTLTLRNQMNTQTLKNNAAQAGNDEDGKVAAIGAAVGAAQTNATAAYSVKLSTQEAGKGLSAKSVQALKDDITKSQQMMLNLFTQQNAQRQSYLSKGVTQLNFDGVKVNTSEFELPEVGTTQEDAKAAVSEGGSYSVDAVAERVMSMAQKIANGDSDKLETMRQAVMKGFEQAGTAFKNTFGSDAKMPQITQDTQDEIMKRFDNVKASYAQQAAGTQNEEAAKKTEM